MSKYYCQQIKKFFLVFFFAITPTEAPAEELIELPACPQFRHWDKCVGAGSLSLTEEIGKYFSSPLRVGRKPFTEYSGNWKDGLPNGQGRMYSVKAEDGSYSEFKGEFKNGVPVFKCKEPPAGFKRKLSYKDEEKRGLTEAPIVFLGRAAQTIRGMYGVTVGNKSLIIRFEQFDYFPELEAPGETRTFFRTYEANPVTSVFLNTVTLGLLALANPAAMANFTAGCNEPLATDYYPIKSKETLTGRGEWKENLTPSAMFVVSGIGLEFESPLKFLNRDGVIAIPDEKLIDLDSGKLQKVEVICKNCFVDTENAPAFPIPEGGGIKLSSRFSFDADFRDSVQKIQEERRLKNIALEGPRNPTNFRLVSPEQAEAISLPGRLSLDASKLKCAELGFKPSTERFGKCVLQLSN